MGGSARGRRAGRVVEIAAATAIAAIIVAWIMLALSACPVGAEVDESASIGEGETRGAAFERERMAGVDGYEVIGSSTEEGESAIGDEGEPLSDVETDSETDATPDVSLGVVDGAEDVDGSRSDPANAMPISQDRIASESAGSSGSSASIAPSETVDRDEAISERDPLEPLTITIRATGCPSVSLPISDTPLWPAAPEHGAGLWTGSESVDDGKGCYIIGHNPGDFENVARLRVGDEIVVCDRWGNARSYRVRELRDVDPSDDWGTPRDMLAPLGESVGLQTCLPSKMYRIVISS